MELYRSGWPGDLRVVWAVFVTMRCSGSILVGLLVSPASWAARIVRESQIVCVT
jgi:hypothetical protein